MLIGLTEEPSFKDTDCPAFYVRDDVPIKTLCKRVQSCIHQWGEAHNVAVNTEVKFGLNFMVIRYIFLHNHLYFSLYDLGSTHDL